MGKWGGDLVGGKKGLVEVRGRCGGPGVKMLKSFKLDGLGLGHR